MFLATSVGFTIYQSIHDHQFSIYFIFISHLNLCATLIVTLIGAIYATMFYFKKISNSSSMSQVLKFYWFLWTQCLVIACIITPFYWIFIYEGKNNVANILKHGTNAVPLIIDLCVVKLPGRYYNFIYMAFVELAYIIFTVIYQFAGGINE